MTQLPQAVTAWNDPEATVGLVRIVESRETGD